MDNLQKKNWTKQYEFFIDNNHFVEKKNEINWKKDKKFTKKYIVKSDRYFVFIPEKEISIAKWEKKNNNDQNFFFLLTHVTMWNFIYICQMKNL